MGIKEYKTLTQNESNVLYHIWLIGFQESEVNATRQYVAKRSDVSIPNLGRILSSIKKIPRDKYYETIRLPEHDKKPPRRGPRPVFYRLKWNTFVTIPLTAKLLVELTKFKKERDGRIDYKKFTSEIKENYGVEVEEVRERLKWAESQDYILLSNNQKFIGTNKRIQCEFTYLSKLASHL